MEPQSAKVSMESRNLLFYHVDFEALAKLLTHGSKSGSFDPDSLNFLKNLLSFQSFSYVSSYKRYRNSLSPTL